MICRSKQCAKFGVVIAVSFIYYKVLKNGLDSLYYILKIISEKNMICINGGGSNHGN